VHSQNGSDAKETPILKDHGQRTERRMVRVYVRCAVQLNICFQHPKHNGLRLERMHLARWAYESREVQREESL